MNINRPDGFGMRAPTLDDAAEVAALIAACQRLDRGLAETSEEGQRADWESVDLTEDAVAIVAPDGHMAGYADILNRRYVRVAVYGYVHPDYRGEGVGSALVRWGEAWIAERIDRAPAEARVVIDHYAAATNATYCALLQAHGYHLARTIYLMEIQLDQPPAEPAWPDGISPRAFVPGQDERAAFDALEDAFQDSWERVTGVYERWLEMTEVERRTPELWTLAIDDASGEIAAACMGQINSGAGWIGAIGTRRPWRKRGLGLAMLQHTFGVMYVRGVRTIQLSVDSESSTGAPRVYQRAGMQTTQHYLVYRKQLREGIGLAEVAAE